MRVEALRQFDNLMVDDGDRFFFQPCFSPVWDTAIAAYALGEAEPAHPESCARGRLAARARRSGARATGASSAPTPSPPAGPSSTRNEFYPDIDDTAMVLLALSEVRAVRSRGAAAPLPSAALNWLLAMQSSDGGWAAFDVDNNWEFLSQVPFADHNAMLDPTCPDITGRVLEALAAHGVDRSHPAVRRGVDYLVEHQEPDGSWYGRWGVAYIYGTCLALRGLAAAGESDREAHILRAGEWLRSIQNADGGWGESCASYDNGIFTAGPEHAFADRLGHSGTDRRRRPGQPQRAARHRVSDRHAARRRHLGRGPRHRHRFPAGLLPELPPVPGLFPAAGAGFVREGPSELERIDQ